MVEKIFLVRHAEAKANEDMTYGGWLDSPLTPMGLEQARSLRKRFTHENIGKIFCSDLQRARDTLRLLDLKAPVEFSKALRERHYGKLEGSRWDDDPERKRHHMDPHAKAPGGESIIDVQERVWDYFQQNVFCCNEHSVLVLSHHGPLVTFASRFLDMPIMRWRALQLGNAGLSILVKEEGIWRLKLWNSLSGLGLKTDRPLLRKRK
ncbi:MAG: histidine phosphatase family protein [Candidatus Micrarchaeia archaeon]|jgi:broad specificity phosphatase PhoE